jgi:hypothetical protein
VIIKRGPVSQRVGGVPEMGSGSELKENEEYDEAESEALKNGPWSWSGANILAVGSQGGRVVCRRRRICPSMSR